MSKSNVITSPWYCAASQNCACENQIVLFSYHNEVSTHSMHWLVHKCVMQDPFLWTGSDVRIRDPDMPTVHFAVAFKGASWSDPDSVALMVMQVTP